MFQEQIRRCISLFLILAQLFVPTHSYANGLGGLNDLINTFTVVTTTASSIGEAQRAREAESIHRKNEQDAKQIFAIAPQSVRETAQNALLDAGGDAYNPNNPVQAKRLLEKFKAAQAMIAKKSVISTDELRIYTESLLPYMRLLEAYARATGAGEVVVPPEAEVAFDTRGFRIDSEAKTASTGTPLRIMPKNQAIPEDLREIYDALMRYSAKYPLKAMDVQYLVDDMSRVANGTIGYHPLGPSQSSMLDAALPGGASKAQNWLSRNAGQYRQNAKPLLNNNPDYGYSLLAPGVAAIAQDTTDIAGQVKIRIRNTTSQPFTFRAQDFIATPPDGQSRMAIGHALNSIDASAEACGSLNRNAASFAKDLIGEAARFLADKKLDTTVLPYLKTTIKSPILQAAMRLSPLIGNGIAAVEAYTGKDVFSGDVLSPAERALAIASIVPFEGDAVRAGTVGIKAIKNGAQSVPGKIVLGHYPEYAELANQINARKFNVPEEFWNKMSADERWSANQRFLDRVIKRGDEVVLATPLNKVREGSYFAKELEYMSSKGYRPNIDGTRLVKTKE